MPLRELRRAVVRGQHRNNKAANAASRAPSYLGLARLALMSRDTDLIEEAVQLTNTAIDLLSQIAGIHGVLRLWCALAAAKKNDDREVDDDVEGKDLRSGQRLVCKGLLI